MTIRALALTAVLGALVAATNVHAASGPTWRDAVAAWVGTFERAPEAKSAIEAWPLCTAIEGTGSGPEGAQLDPDFAAAKKALGAGDWTGAIMGFKLAALRDPRNADIENHIGYAYWRLRQLGPALGHYQRALLLNPRHRGVHEHLGELFLALGEPAQAERHRAALEQICLIPCAELADLESALAATGALPRASRPKR